MITLKNRVFLTWSHCYIHPRQAFLDDLGAFISQCQAAGDAILLLADMNSDIRHHSLAEYFLGQKLHELILSKFPHLPPPATFWQGMRSGKTPIDGAWATDDITINAISWHNMPSSLGNHHAIIVDLNLVDCIGEPWYLIVRPPGRHLNSALPFAQDKYLHLLDEFSSKHHLPVKLNNHFTLACCPSMTKLLLKDAVEQFD